MDAYIFSLEKRPANRYETERNTANVASPSEQVGTCFVLSKLH